MLNNGKNSDLNSAEIKQDDLNLSKPGQDSLNSDIVHDSKKLKDRIIDLLKGDAEFSKMKQGDKALVVGTACGLFAAVLPLLAIGATLAIPGAIVGLTLFFAAKVAVKAVQSGYKGLKWSAEKTVEGAKHIGGKVKDGYENSVDSLKRGASFVSERTANKLHKAAGKEDYSDKLKRFTPKQVEKSDEIRKDLKEIFADKESNSGLVKSVLSGILSKINLKIEEKVKLEETHQALEQLLMQGKFIENLSKESLYSLLTQRSLPKDTYLIDSIFSEHHDEIKEVIRECKARSNTLKNLDEVSKSVKRHKAGSMNSLENSLSRSSLMNSVRTDSTIISKAELLNSGEHKKVKATSSLRDKLPSSLGGKKAPEEVTYTGHQSLSENEMASAEMGNSTSYVASPKPSRSNSTNSIGTESTASFTSYRRNSDSGFNSPNPSPQHGMFAKENGELKTQDDLKKTGSLEKLVEYQQPSSEVTVDSTVGQQAPKIKI